MGGTTEDGSTSQRRNARQIVNLRFRASSKLDEIGLLTFRQTEREPWIVVIAVALEKYLKAGSGRDDPVDLGLTLLHELWGDAKDGTPYDQTQKLKWHRSLERVEQRPDDVRRSFRL